MKKSDRTLGMGSAIDRRDFLDGAALAIGALAVGSPAAAAEAAAPQDRPGYYPPLLQGLRGSHKGAFEAAHALRDGSLPDGDIAGEPEAYDMVIVGGGISGLAAAWFCRAANPRARVLILENHDDFGGHAKRNEFRLGDKLHLMNGGTMLIDSPRPYGPVPAALLKALGIDPVALTAASMRPDVYAGLGRGVFFDAKTFGADRLVAGQPGGEKASIPDWVAFLAKTPLSLRGRVDVLRVETGTADYFPTLDDAARADTLSRMSYQAYLRDIVGAGPEAMAYYQTQSQGEWAAGIDAVSALDAWGFGYPGFAGLKLPRRAWPRMSFTPAGYVEGGSDTFHFPDGNASIARLLVRQLVPGAIPGTSAADVVTARCDYARLDSPANPVRIRLSSIVTGVRNLGDPATSRGVEITYVRQGKRYRVTAGGCVLACWNAMIPYLAPELPESQQAALHSLVKAPLVYTSVALRNWQAFKKLGVARIRAPGGYFTGLFLNWAEDIGGYTAERDPDRPVLLFMNRTPCAPGLPEHDQNRAGRAELLATPFETFEREIRAQLGAMLGPGGFDPATDITGITVNRWPHGYAPEYNYLWQPDVPEAAMPHIAGRQRFGRIAIANSDSGNGAYTDVAIEQGHRAVMELLG